MYFPGEQTTSHKLYTVLELVMLVAMALVVALWLTGCAGQAPIAVNPPPISTDHTLIFAWHQSFTNNPPCSATLTTSCITGFNEGYLDATGKPVQLHTDTAAVCSGTTQPEACTSTFSATFAMGQITFYVETTFVDLTGAANVTARDLSTPVLVGADAATGVTVTVGS